MITSVSKASATYINAALSSVGITCRALKILEYNPTVFGNLTAEAETSVGKLRIIYDRAFYVDAQQQLEPPTIEHIIDALERHKKAANG